MKKFSISNRQSGVHLGTYEAVDEAEALDAMARNAGYADYAAAQEVAPTDEDELVIREVEGLGELTLAIIAAASQFEDEFEGETPRVIYAQLSERNGWEARFSTSEDSEMSMTRWSTGEDVTELFAALKAGKRSAALDYASDIEGGWEDEWTDREAA